MARLLNVAVGLVALWFGTSVVGKHWVSMYQVKMAAIGIKNLFSLSREDIDACVAAYEYLQRGTSEIDGSNTDSRVETEHVRRYYKVLQPLLAIADIEKMYIPPMIDGKLGLYGNQLLHEQQVVARLGDDIRRPDARLLDIGCGAGRVAHYVARLTGASVSGFNIDADQVENAIAYANATGLGDRLDFARGDHHDPFAYPDDAFDAAYSFQALWPFIKKDQLDGVSAEIFRVLKPGAIYGCGEYFSGVF